MCRQLIKVAARGSDGHPFAWLGLVHATPLAKNK